MDYHIQYPLDPQRLNMKFGSRARALAQSLEGLRGFESQIIAATNRDKHTLPIELIEVGPNTHGIISYFILTRGDESYTPLNEWIEKQVRVNNRQDMYNISIQMCLAVKALHDEGFIHRDIKISNFLVDPATHTVMIFDYETVKHLNSNQNPNNPLGISTEGYAPYELHPGIPHKEHTLRSDIFALGMTLIYLFSHGEINPETILDHNWIRDSAKKYFISNGYPDKFVEVLFKATNRTPSERYANTDELMTDLKSSLSNIVYIHEEP